jgi:membrane protease YdiL (CAAX protease family)
MPETDSVFSARLFMDFLTQCFFASLPAVVIMLAALLLKPILQRRQVPEWHSEQYVRILGILVFLLSIVVLSSVQWDQLLALLTDQWPLNTRDVGALVVSIPILVYAQFRHHTKSFGSGTYAAIRPAEGKLPIILFIGVWFVYLLLYELYFRGYLLFIAFPEMPLWMIVGFNVFLYSFVHVVKNRQQVLLSIPFGLVLVGITYYTGHIWFAFIIHLVLAIGFELPPLLKREPEVYQT